MGTRAESRDLQILEYQTIRSARRTLGLDRSQVEVVKGLFSDLKKTSVEYRWLEALRDALQHGDINAFKWSFNVSVRADPEVKINMDRAFMLEFINDNRNKPWLKRRELEELDSDPGVLEMIKAIQLLMGPLSDFVLWGGGLEPETNGSPIAMSGPNAQIPVFPCTPDNFASKRDWSDSGHSGPFPLIGGEYTVTETAPRTHPAWNNA